MVTRDQLSEVESLVRDLRMCIDFQESSKQDAPFVILPVREPVSIVMPDVIKEEVIKKTASIQADLKIRLTELCSVL
jgi:hypothetical protein